MRITNRLFFIAVSSSILITCTTMNAIAQQRDPNQPRPTQTPTPTPAPIKPPKDGRVVTTSSAATAGLSQRPGIFGQIRWRKELGLPYDSTKVRPPYQICAMFNMRMTVQEPGSPGTFGQTRVLDVTPRISGNPTQDNGYYVCSYERADNGLLPHDRPLMVLVELDARLLRGAESGRWSVGGDTLPPPGQQRVIIIIGGRNGVTLTDRQPHATLDFEMVYRSIPAPPR